MSNFVIGISHILVSIVPGNLENILKKLKELKIKPGNSVHINNELQRFLKTQITHIKNISNSSFIPIKILSQYDIPVHFFGDVGADEADFIKESLFMENIPFTLEVLKEHENLLKYICEYDDETYTLFAGPKLYSFSLDFLQKHILSITTSKIIIHSNYSLVYTRELSEFILKNIKNDQILLFDLLYQCKKELYDDLFIKFYDRADIIFGSLTEIKNLYEYIYGTKCENITDIVVELASGKKKVVCINGEESLICSDETNSYQINIDEIKLKNMKSFSREGLLISGFLFGMNKNLSFLECIEKSIELSKEWTDRLNNDEKLV
ncbi:hypothetical protein SLOPH_863 [Spraguea lophii 42_110]|uniref:Uncharacterized protein n=1 Tax=Spraguea lophii (strain 42_110) TaxID=1358809 RepID=S7W8H9_SPRLO|nr:hypothetical protein SLOPH_863 [Spraguea lophii 42_110]